MGLVIVFVFARVLVVVLVVFFIHRMETHPERMTPAEEAEYDILIPFERLVPGKGWVRL